MAQTSGVRLLNNSRFYILNGSILLSVAVFSWLRIQISSDQLFFIRAEQVFGLLCVGYWYLALTISPIGYVVGKQRTKRLEFSRRAIGVSAFYFALLHAAIALWGQLGGFTQLQYLPSLFQWSLLGGLVAFVILLIMAATSFDKVVKIMTFRKWKWLHRLVYIGGILAVFHIWSVGTHISYGGIRVAALVALIILAGLELYRVTKLLNDKYLHLDRTESLTVYVVLWAIVSTLILLFPTVIQNYHSQHMEHGDASSHRKEAQ